MEKSNTRGLSLKMRGAKFKGDEQGLECAAGDGGGGRYDSDV